MPKPRIELVLTTKNAMPHLKKTFNALKSTKYSNLKLIVQDCCSNDGTLEYIAKQNQFFDIDLVSAPDSGIGHAISEAFKRISRVDFVTIIAADEELKENFFEIHLKQFRNNPNLLVTYGSVLLINPKTNIKIINKPNLFSLENIITCKTIPPISTCMFNVKALGEDFSANEKIKFCPDFERWIRLALKFPAERFLNIPEVLSVNRMDEVSNSFNADSYLHHARSKVNSLKMHLDKIKNYKPALNIEPKDLFIDIYIWAAEMVFSLKGANQDFINIVSEAIKEFGNSDKLLKLVSRSDQLLNWVNQGCEGDLIFKDNSLLNYLNTQKSLINLKLGLLHDNNGAKRRTIFWKKLKLIGGDHKWGYIWTIDLKYNKSKDSHNKHFDNPKLVGVNCILRVEKGQIGVCILKENQIDEEVVVVAATKEKEINLKVRISNENPILCIRNYGMEKSVLVLSKIVLLKKKTLRKINGI